MSLMTAAMLAGALLVPAAPAPPTERPLILALNPQPEPPGKSKIKRIYSGKDDSRRNKPINPKPVKPAPAKY